MSDYYYPDDPRTELIAFLPQQYRTVLEIGCGTGGFKNSLNPGIEIWGIEPNQSASEQAKMKGYKVLTGLYDNVENQCPDHYFDLIICNDVIEHMIDHEKFLVDIKSKMKSDAVMIGSIPNIRYYTVLFNLLFKKDWEYQETGVLDKTHLRFFTEKSLKRTLEKSGYYVEKFAGINDAKYYLTWVSVIKYLLINFSFGLFKDTKFKQFAFVIKYRLA
ncbi:MAG: class I SAM-dependent methyltransferase [Methylotenera sp.]|nr:class I SAM-dependent methyltransferase [Methylotenera sp.]